MPDRLVTLSALGKIFNILKYFSYFSQKTGFDSSRKLSHFNEIHFKGRCAQIRSIFLVYIVSQNS